MSDSQSTKKPVKEVSLPKFNRPDFQNIGANKFRQTFKPTARMGTINRSRR